MTAPLTAAVVGIGPTTVVVVEMVPGPAWVATLHGLPDAPGPRQFVADHIDTPSGSGEQALAVSLATVWAMRLAFELGAWGDLYLLGGVISEPAWLEAMTGMVAVEQARVGVVA